MTLLRSNNEYLVETPDASQPTTPPDTPGKSSTSTSPPTRHSIKKSTKGKDAAVKNPGLLVTLYSGSDPQKFVVHKDFVCHHSPVLEAAFNSEFVEGQTQECKLEGISKGTIRLLINWFYTQKFDVEPLDDDGASPAEYFIPLIKLWVLADMLLIPALQNALIKEMHKTLLKSKELPTKSFDLVYKETAANSPLRGFFVDICARHLAPINFLTFKEDFPKEMLVDLVTVFASSHSDRNKLMPNNKLQPYFLAEEFDYSRRETIEGRVEE